jgi:hypothetical protein
MKKANKLKRTKKKLNKAIDSKNIKKMTKLLKKYYKICGLK